jgi:hypothetical protein
MNSQSLRKKLQDQGLTQVEALYIATVMHVPHLSAIEVKSDHGTMWRITYADNEYTMDAL